MSDFVWLTNFETSDGPFRDYVSGDLEGLPSKPHVAGQMNLQGDVVPPVAVPTCVKPASAKAKALGELNLLPGRFILIGPKTAEVVSQFDLGAGALHGVAVLDRNGTEVSKGEFFFWNYGNKLSHFVPEQSQELDKSNYGHEKPGEHIYFPPVIPKNDTIAFSAECKSAPVAWVEKFLGKGTVFSNALHEALDNQGLAKAFELVRCRVV